MSKHEVKVVKVENVRVHPNADSLEITDVWGYQCVVGKGKHNVGDLLAFIEPDYTVPLNKPEFAFLDKGKGKLRERITMRKFRGEPSYGLLIPAPAGSQEGDDVMSLLDVERYEPPMGGSGKGGPTGFMSGLCETGPEFPVPVYDLESFRKYHRLFEEGEEVIISCKIHGTNGRFVFAEGKMFCGSRTTWKKAPGVSLGVKTYKNEETGEEVTREMFTPDSAWWAALKQNPWIEAWCRSHEGVVLYGEVYGCFQYKTPIRMADGSNRMIGEIVNQQRPVSVKALNLETGAVEDCKVVRFSKKESAPDEWLHVTYKRKNWGGRATGLILTKDHRVFTSNFSEITADQLEIGSEVFLYSPQTINPIQEQIVLGGLAGDGHIGENHVFSTGHCLEQEDYLREKHYVLGDALSTIEKTERLSGYGAPMKRLVTRSLHTRSSVSFRELCYSNHGKKKITKEWLDRLSAVGLAIWYCDDGTLCRVQGKPAQSSIATHSFSLEELNLIVSWLTAKGIDCYTIQANEGNILKFSPNGTKSLHLLIAPFVPESMRYKLVDECRQVPYVLRQLADSARGWSQNYVTTIITSKRTISEEEYKARNLRWKYDIEVEKHHNFFANNVLVHNCNVQGAQFHYGKNQGEYGFAVFDILDHGRWVDNTQLFDDPAYNDGLVETVKLLYRGPLDKTIVFSLSELDSAYPNQKVREGVVIKPVQERRDMRLGRIALKNVSDRYLSM